jgi:hypothetical protein
MYLEEVPFLDLLLLAKRFQPSPLLCCVHRPKLMLQVVSVTRSNKQ